MDIVKKIYHALLELVETFVFFGAIFLLIYAFLFRPYQVNGDSMIPNFQNGEYILTSLISVKASKIERGDIIVFNAPPNAEKDYIKRVIGLPGDKIKLLNGDIYLNGKIINENSYLPQTTRTYGENFLKENQEITVPDNNYFVLGDNRPLSSDSRDWGFVSKDKIIGKSVIVYWPPDKFQIIKEMNYNSASNN